jgi:hypothetical protein
MIPQIQIARNFTRTWNIAFLDDLCYNLGFGRLIFWSENNVRNLEPCIYFEEHMYCRNPKIEVRFEILPFAAKIW